MRHNNIIYFEIMMYDCCSTYNIVLYTVRKIDLAELSFFYGH